MSADADFLQAMHEGLSRLDQSLNPHLRGLSPAQRMMRKELLAYRRYYREYYSWCKVTPWFDTDGQWHWDRSPPEDDRAELSPANREAALAALADLEGRCREHGDTGFLAATLGLRARLLHAFGSSPGEAGDLALEALQLARSTDWPNLAADLERFLAELGSAG